MSDSLVLNRVQELARIKAVLEGLLQKISLQWLCFLLCHYECRGRHILGNFGTTFFL